MLRTLQLRYCSPACDLRKVCHATAGLPRTRTLGIELRRYCQHTRWLVIGSITASAAIVSAIYLTGGPA